MAARAGKSLSEQLEEFADQRVQSLLERYSLAGGRDLREPRAVPKLNYLRGSVEQFVADAETPAQLSAYARTAARSGANAAHNAAVLAIARANRKVVEGVMALATLDDRTTDLCRSRHGGAWTLDGEPLPWSTVFERFPGRPPWHHNCRTTLSPIFIDEHEPEIQEESREDWVDSAAGREAFGDRLADAFLRGRITFAQLLAMEPEGDDA